MKTLAREAGHRQAASLSHDTRFNTFRVADLARIGNAEKYR